MRFHAAFVMVSLACVGVANAQPDPYAAGGIQYGAAYFSQLPFERISTTNGNLILTFVDLSLPGDGGFNLDIVRTYNGKQNQWRIGIGDVPMYFWYGACNDNTEVVFFATDGSEYVARGEGAQTLTPFFGRYTKSARTLEFPDGRIATYGDTQACGDGFLTEISDPFGNTISVDWNLSGAAYVESVTQEVGGSTREVVFDSGLGGITYNGRTIAYDWECVSGQPTCFLEHVSYPDTPNWTFEYEEDVLGTYKLTQITTPHGGTIAYEWIRADFDIFPAGRWAVLTRATGGRSPSATWEFDWDIDDDHTTLTIDGPDSTVVYESDKVGERLLSTTRTLKTTGGSVLRTETITMTEVLGIERGDDQWVPVPGAITIEQDGRTYTTTYSYSSSNYADYHHPNQIVAEGELTRTTNITYSHMSAPYILGRPVSVTTTVGSQSTSRSMQYSGSTGFLTSSTVDGVATALSDDGHGNVASVTDANGHVTTFTYQAGVLKNTATPAGTVTRTINADGTVASQTVDGQTTSYGYDDAGRLISVSAPGMPTATTDLGTSGGFLTSATATQGNSSVESTIDGFGRVTEAEDSAGVHVKSTYDGLGRVTYKSYPFDGVTSETGETYTYNPLGRVTAITRPSGASSTSISYSGTSSGLVTAITTSQTGSLTRTTSRTFASFGSPEDGRLVSVTDAASNTWTYGYDVAGRLTTASTTGVSRTVGSYDSHGFLSSTTHPESGTTSFQHDAVGNVTYRQDSRGSSYGVSFQYDAANRLILVDAPGTDDDVATSYNGAGLVSALTTTTGHTAFSYDAAGRVIYRLDLIDGYPFIQRYAYDSDGNLSTVRYPGSGRTVLYEYGDEHRLTAVKLVTPGSPPTSVNLATSIAYHASGAIKSYTLGNGQTRSVTFDALQRPSQLQDGPLDITYAYDLQGNVSGITDARGSGYSSSYGYDALNRLTSVTGYAATTYSYDAVGNRTSLGSITYNYNSSTQRLTSLSGGATGSFTYDDTGSMLSDPNGSTFQYTGLGMLKQHTLSSTTTAYRYGGEGLRTMKTEASGTKHYYVRGAGGALLAEFTKTGSTVTPVREYIYLGGQLLATFEVE